MADLQMMLTFVVITKLNVSFCFTLCKVIRIQKSRKFLLVDSGILGLSEIRNSANGNPASLRLESVVHSVGIQNPWKTVLNYLLIPWDHSPHLGKNGCKWYRSCLVLVLVTLSVIALAVFMKAMGLLWLCWRCCCRKNLIDMRFYSRFYF